MSSNVIPFPGAPGVSRSSRPGRQRGTRIPFTLPELREIAEQISDAVPEILDCVERLHDGGSPAFHDFLAYLEGLAEAAAPCAALAAPQPPA